jgi:hypothetical protein
MFFHKYNCFGHILEKRLSGGKGVFFRWPLLSLNEIKGKWYGIMIREAFDSRMTDVLVSCPKNVFCNGEYLWL